MSVIVKLKNEIRSLSLVMLYFAVWIGVMMLLKTLILAEYHVAFHGFSLALVGVLVLSKVVLILEHVPLGGRVQTRPALFDVLMRTVLYGLGVFAVLVLERGFEGKAEHGGFVAALKWTFASTDINHICANVIFLSSALMVYNVLSVLRRHYGEGALFRLLLQPLPKES